LDAVVTHTYPGVRFRELTLWRAANLAVNAPWLWRWRRAHDSLSTIEALGASFGKGGEKAAKALERTLRGDDGA
jgi:hypothetical protein